VAIFMLKPRQPNQGVSERLNLTSSQDHSCAAQHGGCNCNSIGEPRCPRSGRARTEFRRPDILGGLARSPGSEELWTTVCFGPPGWLVADGLARAGPGANLDYASPAEDLESHATTPCSHVACLRLRALRLPAARVIPPVEKVGNGAPQPRSRGPSSIERKSQLQPAPAAGNNARAQDSRCTIAGSV
jgi:hypothetical protein